MVWSKYKIESTTQIRVVDTELLKENNILIFTWFNLSTYEAGLETYLRAIFIFTSQLHFPQYGISLIHSDITYTACIIIMLRSLLCLEYSRKVNFYSTIKLKNLKRRKKINFFCNNNNNNNMLKTWFFFFNWQFWIKNYITANYGYQSYFLE